jgi:hypothetical protein
MHVLQITELLAHWWGYHNYRGGLTCLRCLGCCGCTAYCGRKISPAIVNRDFTGRPLIRLAITPWAEESMPKSAKRG